MRKRQLLEAILEQKEVVHKDGWNVATSPRHDVPTSPRRDVYKVKLELISFTQVYVSWNGSIGVSQGRPTRSLYAKY